MHYYTTNDPIRALQSRLSIVVTEEMTRRTKEARLELRRYMREVKKYSPEKNCQLEYDKLRVDGKTFIFREVQFTRLHLKLIIICVYN